MPESLTFITFVLSLASTAAIHFGDIRIRRPAHARR